MCRIAGFWDFDHRGTYNAEATLVAMRDSMTYGGPDDAGTYLDPETGVALGHRRLSILDLSPLGHQPMCDDTGNIWITYNGEVYNFQDIRVELEAAGYRFRSNSDTEVMVKAYDAWGLDAVKKFRGMFAFALWDRRTRELILCRDRAGVKPLYWYQRDGVFLFSSELKAMHRHPGFVKEIDRQALSSLLSLGYITAPYSIFCNVQRLEPGTMLVINDRQEKKIVRYWDVREAYLNGVEMERQGYWEKRSEEDIADELESVLRKAFSYRMVSDVPVGVFLSGGIDSSTLCALLTKEGFHLKTFTIGFNEAEFSEAEPAREIARHLGTDHTELVCTPDMARGIIAKLPEMYDEPFGDDSAIPTHLVSQLARRYVTVSLSADAGDELFCGYNKYPTLLRRIQRQRSYPGLPVLGGMLGMVHPDVAYSLYHLMRPVLPEYDDFKSKFMNLRRRLSARTAEELDYLTRVKYQKDELTQHGLPSPYPTLGNSAGLDDVNGMIYRDFVTYLPDDILVKVDRASMAVALESREPFIDHLVVEFAASLPSRLKYRGGVMKYLLRKVLYRHVPQRLLDRPKQGFGVPIEQWFRAELRELLIEYLSPSRLNREGFFNAGIIQRHLKDYLENHGVGMERLWFLLMFEMWYERWMER
ncbi:MAG TPA: asparagine synthase (glutamine-hydrolyzing) [Bacteroidota bacterium]